MMLANPRADSAQTFVSKWFVCLLARKAIAREALRKCACAELAPKVSFNLLVRLSAVVLHLGVLRAEPAALRAPAWAHIACLCQALHACRGELVPHVLHLVSSRIAFVRHSHFLGCVVRCSLENSGLHRRWPSPRFERPYYLLSLLG